MAEEYVELNDMARNAYKNFLPGPVSVVSKGRGTLARGIESTRGTQSVRISSHPFVQELVKQYGKPITSTSANVSYKKNPYSLQDILDNTSQKQQALVELFVDAGELPRRKPSTVIDTTLEGIHIVRQGEMAIEGSQVFESASLEDTGRFVEHVFAELAPVLGKKLVVFLLQGDLGAGKTHMAKDIGRQLSVAAVVKSPTYTIYTEYAGSWDDKPITMIHMDTYRLYDAAEIDDLRPQELFAAPNVVVIEWANKVVDHIASYLADAAVVKVNIDTLGETRRRFSYSVQV